MSEYIVNVSDEEAELFIARFGIGGTQMFGHRLVGEIVRCRDCKHFTPKGTHKFENGKINEDYCDYVRGWMLQITPDGFCAWGERRTDD